MKKTYITPIVDVIEVENEDSILLNTSDTKITTTNMNDFEQNVNEDRGSSIWDNEW